MTVVEEIEDANNIVSKTDSVWYSAICDMPSEPGLFFYWFEIEVNGSRTWYTADLEHKNGCGRFSPTRPSFLPGESMTPAPFQVTVHLSHFSVPENFGARAGKGHAFRGFQAHKSPS